MNKLPIARSQDIVVQEIGKEILIYDLKTNKAYSLNETCSIVYKNCDGKTTFSDLKSKHKFTDDIIFLALDELRKDDLIEVDNSFVSPFVGMNRREVIRRVGLASMIALPIISSLVAPTAAMAGSGAKTANCASCTTDAQCASGNCAMNAGVCKAGTGESAALPGAGVGISNTQLDCTTFGAPSCCSGSATLNGSVCRCDPA